MKNKCTDYTNRNTSTKKVPIWLVLLDNLPTFAMYLLGSYILTYFSEPLIYLCVSNFIFDSLFLILILLFSKNEFKLSRLKKVLIQDYIKDVKPLILASITIVIATNLGNLILDYFFGHESLAYVSLVINYIIPL